MSNYWVGLGVCLKAWVAVLVYDVLIDNNLLLYVVVAM